MLVDATIEHAVLSAVHRYADWLWITESGHVDSSDARWSDLAADLDALADAQESAESDAMIADLTRAEHATITLADRLRAARGSVVVVDLADGHPVRGVVRAAAREWLRVGARTRGDGMHLIPLTAIDGVSGLGRAAVPAAGREAAVTVELRGLQRDRSPVLVRTRGGVHRGRIARVGADHLDVDVLDRGRRLSRTVPYAALLCVSHAPGGLEF